MFIDDFPMRIRHHCTFLLDLKNRRLECRGGLSNGADLSNCYWVVDISKDENHSCSVYARMISGPPGDEQRLVKYTSETQAAVAEIFRGLVGNAEEDIELTYSPNNKNIIVKLWLTLKRGRASDLQFGFSVDASEDIQII